MQLYTHIHTACIFFSEKSVRARVRVEFAFGFQTYSIIYIRILWRKGLAAFAALEYTQRARAQENQTALSAPLRRLLQRIFVYRVSIHYIYIYTLWDRKNARENDLSCIYICIYIKVNGPVNLAAAIRIAKVYIFARLFVLIWNWPRRIIVACV